MLSVPLDETDAARVGAPIAFRVSDRMLRIAFAASVVLHLLVFVVLPRLESAKAPELPPLMVQLRETPPEPIAPKQIPPPEPPVISRVAPVRPPSPAPMPQRAAVEPPPRPAPETRPEPAPTPAPRVEVPAAPPAVASAPATDAPKVVAVAPPVARPPAEPAPVEPRKAPSAEVYTPAVANAAYLKNPAPPYPRSSRQRGEEGTVTLLVRVAADGRPLDVSVHRSSGFPALDRSARDVVARDYRFLPARLGEKAIEGEVFVPVEFVLGKE